MVHNSSTTVDILEQQSSRVRRLSSTTRLLPLVLDLSTIVLHYLCCVPQRNTEPFVFGFNGQTNKCDFDFMTKLAVLHISHRVRRGGWPCAAGEDYIPWLADAVACMSASYTGVLYAPREAAFRENVERSVIYFVFSSGFRRKFRVCGRLWTPHEEANHLAVCCLLRHSPHTQRYTLYHPDYWEIKAGIGKEGRAQGCESRRRRDERHNFLLFASLL